MTCESCKRTANLIRVAKEHVYTNPQLAESLCNQALLESGLQHKFDIDAMVKDAVEGRR